MFVIEHWKAYGRVALEGSPAMMVCPCGVRNFSRWYDGTWIRNHESHRMDGVAESAWFLLDRYRDIVRERLRDLSPDHQSEMLAACERAMIAGATWECFGWLASWLCPVTGRS